MIVAIKLSSQLIEQIKKLLLDVYELEDVERRKQFARNAEFPSRLFQQIHWQDQINPFIDDFVFKCSEWGPYTSTDFRHPLEEYLKTLQEFGGGEFRTALAKILIEIRSELGTSEKSKEPPEIQFVNRENEILYLGDPKSMVTRFAIHAPAGFGKTWLLKKLQEKFSSPSQWLPSPWLVSYAKWTPNKTLYEFSNELLSSFNSTLSINNDIVPSSEIPLQLAQIYKQEWNERYTKSSGIVIMIDCENLITDADQKTFFELISVWLESFAQEIQGLKVFSSESNLFRIFIAGRFFRDEIRSFLSSYQFRIHTLGTLEEALEQSVRGYLADIKSEWQVELWTNLYHLTGGHPGCFSKILKWYWIQNKPNPSFFFEKRSSEIRKIVTDEVNSILDDFPIETKQLLLALCPFRAMSYEILDDILASPDKILKWDKDVLLLQDHLTYTSLVQVDKYGILRDGISRRIMTLKQRYSQDNGISYPSKCLQARNIYQHRLQDPSEQQLAHFWAIEYLYLTLHASEETVKTKKERDSLRTSFWGPSENIELLHPNTILHECLNMLTNHRDGRRVIRLLQRALNDDWDFQFTLNYYLREDRYDYKWFSLLQSKIQNYFTGLA